MNYKALSNNIRLGGIIIGYAGGIFGAGLAIFGIIREIIVGRVYGFDFIGYSYISIFMGLMIFLVCSLLSMIFNSRVEEGDKHEK